MSLPAPPTYDDVMNRRSYCSSVQQLTATDVSNPHAYGATHFSIEIFSTPNNFIHIIMHYQPIYVVIIVQIFFSKLAIKLDLGAFILYQHSKARLHYYTHACVGVMNMLFPDMRKHPNNGIVRPYIVNLSIV